MSQILKQSTAYTFRLGPFIDKTDGNTQENALTIAYTDVLLSKAGGALTAKNDTTNLTGTGANAHYTCVLNTTDTNTLGGLRVWCHISVDALPVWQDFLIVPANVYDSLVAGSDNLQVDTTQWVGVAPNALIAGRVDSNAQVVGDKTGYSLSAAGLQAIWDVLTSALTTVGSIGKLIVDNLNATVSSRSSHSVADIWNALTSGMTTVGSIGKKLADWALGSDNRVLNSANAHTSGQTVANMTDKTGMSVAVGGIGSTAFGAGAVDSAALAADAANEIADSLINRNIAGGSSTGRLVKDTLRLLRNKRAISGGTLTVYQEDDTTSAWTATITTAAGNPIDSVDPA